MKNRNGKPPTNRKEWGNTHSFAPEIILAISNTNISQSTVECKPGITPFSVESRLPTPPVRIVVGLSPVYPERLPGFQTTF